MKPKDERAEELEESPEAERSSAIDQTDEDGVLILEDTGEDLSSVELLEELRGDSDAAEGGPQDASEEARVAALEDEIATLKERHLRALADFENLRRRSIKERADARHQATFSVLREIVPIIDNFDAALAIPVVEGADPGFRDGVELIARQFRDTLTRLGVTEVPGVGSPFDPSHHEAVAQEERDDLDHNTVAAVFRKGYLMGDRLLRPSMVKVATRPVGGGATPETGDQVAPDEPTGAGPAPEDDGSES